MVGRAFRWAERHPDRAVLLALGGATVFRLVYVARIGNHLAGPDAVLYDTAGRDLVRHGLLWPHVDGLPEWSPGYPLLLALHYALLGRHPFTVALTQTAMIGGLTWLTYRLARRLVSERAALVTGIGMSASFAWLALPVGVMYEPWLAFFFVATLLLLLRWDEEKRPWSALVAGLLLGLAAGFHAKSLVLVPFVVIWMLLGRRERHQVLLGGLALVVGVGLVVAPLVVRNDVVYGQPIVIAAKAGLELVYGNNPAADGTINSKGFHTTSCPGIDRNSTDYMGNDARFVRCAIRLAVHHPAHELSILPTKFFYFWMPFIGPAQPRNWSHDFDFRKLVPPGVRRSRWFRNADLAGSALWVAGELLLLVLGMTLTVRRAGGRRAGLAILPIAWLLATHLATYGDPRFRIPIIPLAWMFEAAGMVAIVEWTRARRTTTAVRDEPVPV